MPIIIHVMVYRSMLPWCTCIYLYICICTWTGFYNVAYSLDPIQIVFWANKTCLILNISGDHLLMSPVCKHIDKSYLSPLKLVWGRSDWTLLSTMVSYRDGQVSVAEETEVPGENRRPSTSNWHTFQRGHRALIIFAAKDPVERRQPARGQSGCDATQTSDLPLERPVIYHWTKAVAH